MKCGIHYPHMGMSCSFCLKPHPHHNFPSTSVGTGLIRHTGLAALANLALSPSATGPTQTLCSIRGHPRRRSDQRVHVRNSGPRPRIAGPAAAGHRRPRGDRTPDATREDTSQAPNGDTKAVGQALPIPPQFCLVRLPQSAPRPVCRLPADSSR